VALGLLTYDGEVFTGTPLLQTLHGDHPLSLKNYAQIAASPVFWHPMLFLPESVAEGRNRAAQALGAEVFEYFAEHPGEAVQFGAAMTELSMPVLRDAVAVIDPAGATSVVDVGGANGAFLAGLLRQHPQLTGVVLDLPHVMPGVAELAAGTGLTDRITGVPGDFFASVPSADIYLLKHILHDWDDDSAHRILTSIRKAMNPGARLFVVEMAITGAPMGAAMLDMVMLFATTGKERDLSEYEALLTGAGFRTVATAPIHRPYFVLEATPA
jgi:hypothetical protein